MTRPTQDAIDTFIRITGASESLARRKLEEYGGDLGRAVNAHFSEVEGHIKNQMPTLSPQHNPVNMGNSMQRGQSGFLPLLSAARSFKPSLLLDPNYRRNLYNQIGASVFTGPEPRHSQTGEFHNSYAQPYHPGHRPAIEDASGTSWSHGPQIHGNVKPDGGSHLYTDDVEEEMIKLAIEASRREESSNTGLLRRQVDMEDEDFARAVSLSLKTAEEEKATLEQHLEDQNQRQGVHETSGRANETSDDGWKKLNPGSSSVQEGAADAQEPLWGGISSRELDEAIRLEEALFCGSPERNSLEQAPSTSLVPQQLVDEYLVSLLADREKESRAHKESEPSCLKEGESQNKILEEEEFSRLLAAKEASLPPEPAGDDENAVTLLVRMPDGSRHGRRFLKSDKLLVLFHFIDVGRAVKPGTYRVVRPYPKRVFSLGDCSSSLYELGLTSKLEALFLELI